MSMPWRTGSPAANVPTSLPSAGQRQTGSPEAVRSGTGSAGGGRGGGLAGCTIGASALPGVASVALPDASLFPAETDATEVADAAGATGWNGAGAGTLSGGDAGAGVDAGDAVEATDRAAGAVRRKSSPTRIVYGAAMPFHAAMSR